MSSTPRFESNSSIASSGWKKPARARQQRRGSSCSRRRSTPCCVADFRAFLAGRTHAADVTLMTVRRLPEGK
jgi:hypothetical protein